MIPARLSLLSVPLMTLLAAPTLEAEPGDQVSLRDVASVADRGLRELCSSFAHCHSREHVVGRVSVTRFVRIVNDAHHDRAMYRR